MLDIDKININNQESEYFDIEELEIKIFTIKNYYYNENKNVDDYPINEKQKESKSKKLTLLYIFIIVGGILAILIIFIVCIIKCRKKRLRNQQLDNEHIQNIRNNLNRQPIRNNLNRQPIRNNSNRQPIRNNSNRQQIEDFLNNNNLRNNVNIEPIRNNSNRQQRENIQNEHQIIHFSNNNQENENKRKKELLFNDKLYPIIYNKEFFKENNNNSCSICLEYYIDKKSLISLTPCNHIFHFNCLKKWSMKNAGFFRCPNCNYDFMKEKMTSKNVRHNNININIDNNFINSNLNTSSLRANNIES